MAAARYKKYFLGREYRENQEPARAYILRGVAYSEEEYWYPKDKSISASKIDQESLSAKLKALLKSSKL